MNGVHFFPVRCSFGFDHGWSVASPGDVAIRELADVYSGHVSRGRYTPGMDSIKDIRPIATQNAEVPGARVFLAGATVQIWYDRAVWGAVGDTPRETWTFRDELEAAERFTAKVEADRAEGWPEPGDPRTPSTYTGPLWG